MEPALDVHERQGVERRVWWQAAALTLVVAGDGILAVALGAPAWLAFLYLALGRALGAGRIWFARRRRAPATPPASTAAPEPAAPTPAPALRAIGYALIESPNNGELGARTQAIKACCEQRGLELTAMVH